MPTRPVDLNNIKGRIAEALVESIFRRAEFKMTETPRNEPTIQHLLQDLTSQDWEDRKQVLKALIEEQLKDERILAVVKTIELGKERRDSV